MNTVAIDSDMYKGAAEYAERYDMSIKEVVEHGIQLLIGNMSANKAKNRTKAGGLSTKEALDFVRTLSANGGSVVPADENGIDALVEEKYKL